MCDIMPFSVLSCHMYFMTTYLFPQSLQLNCALREGKTKLLKFACNYTILHLQKWAKIKLSKFVHNHIKLYLQKLGNTLTFSIIGKIISTLVYLKSCGEKNTEKI